MIPVRSFTRGKSRLSGALGSGAQGTQAHESFVRDLADRAADAAGARPVAVVTSATEVVTWATARNLAVVADRGSLDAAARAGRDWAAEQGCARVIVVHADLPDIVTLDAVAGDGAAPVAVLVPCHRDDGTPVLSVPTRAVAGFAPFEFAYGPGSFVRHRAAAQAAGLAVRIVVDDALGFDVDGPDDLAILLARRAAAAPKP